MSNEKPNLSEVVKLLEESQMILHEECVDNVDSGLISGDIEYYIRKKTLKDVVGVVIIKIKQLMTGSLKVNIDGSVKTE